MSYTSVIKFKIIMSKVCKLKTEDLSRWPTKVQSKGTEIQVYLFYTD